MGQLCWYSNIHVCLGLAYLNKLLRKNGYFIQKAPQILHHFVWLISRYPLKQYQILKFIDLVQIYKWDQKQAKSF